jgi:hypothetical protein
MTVVAQIDELSLQKTVHGHAGKPSIVRSKMNRPGGKNGVLREHVFLPAQIR